MSLRILPAQAELQRYGGSREGAALVAATNSDAKTASPTSTGTRQSRPPRPPPPINTKGNMYAASAAAVMGGQYASSGSSSTSNTIRRGTSTPPRMAGDPGSKGKCACHA
jgi:hypothetical protein